MELTSDEIVNISISMDRSEYSLDDEFYQKMRNLRMKLNVKTPKMKNNQSYIKKYEKELGESYKILNKISEKLYDKHLAALKNVLDTVDNIELREKICLKIFDVASKSLFYSKLYAKLIADLFKCYNDFKIIFEDKFDTFYNDFKKIHYVSPNENYDDYCAYIKHCDELKTFMMFIVNLVKNDAFALTRVMSIFIDLQEKFMENIHEESKLYENECYVMTIHSALTEIIDELFGVDEWSVFLDNLKLIENSQGSGKSNKIRFKFMDIRDLINKKKK